MNGYLFFSVLGTTQRRERVLLMKTKGYCRNVNEYLKIDSKLSITGVLGKSELEINEYTQYPIIRNGLIRNASEI